VRCAVLEGGSTGTVPARRDVGSTEYVHLTMFAK
jgi:hypothetical protein